MSDRKRGGHKKRSTLKCTTLSTPKQKDVVKELIEIKNVVETTRLSRDMYVELCIKALKLKNSVETELLTTESRFEIVRLNNVLTQSVLLYNAIVSEVHPAIHPFHISIDADVELYCPLFEMLDLVALSMVNKSCNAFATIGIRLRYREWCDVEPFEDMKDNLQAIVEAKGWAHRSTPLDEFVQLMKSKSTEHFFNTYASSNCGSLILLRKSGEAVPDNFIPSLYFESDTEQSAYKKLRYLKKLQVNLNGYFHKGEPLLSRAIYVGTSEIVQLLVEMGADPTMRYSSSKKVSIILKAYELYEKRLSTYSFQILGALLSGVPHDTKPFKCYEGGEYFMIRAIRQGDLPMLNLLLEHNQWPFSSKYNPVLKICKHYSRCSEETGIKMLVAILNSSAATDNMPHIVQALNYCIDNDLAQCIHYITNCFVINHSSHPCNVGIVRNIPMFKKLIDAIVTVEGPDSLNIIDESNCSLLTSICYDDNTERARYLIEKGDKIDLVIRDGWRPIHYASWSCSIEHVQLLLEKGVEVDVRDDKGKTPLMNAAANGYYSLCKLLVEYGADVCAVDLNGDTVLSYALRSSNMTTVQFFLDQGADPDIRKNFSFAI